MAVNDPDVKREMKQLRDKAYSDPLAQVRNVAGKWAGTLSALVGVTTVVGLIVSRDIFNELSPAAKWAFVLVFIVALIVAISSVYSAAYAAEGTPKKRWTSVDDFQDWYEQAVPKANNLLRYSRISALVSAALVVILACILWFGPGGTSGTSVLAVQRSGTVICGTLQNNPAGNLVLVTSQQKSIPLTDITSVSVVASCP